MIWSNLNGKRIWKRIDIYICLTNQFCCTSETIIILLINYTPIENKNIETIFLEKKENTHTHTYAMLTEMRQVIYIFELARYGTVGSGGD